MHGLLCCMSWRQSAFKLKQGFRWSNENGCKSLSEAEDRRYTYIGTCRVGLVSTVTSGQYNMGHDA